jgi:hypothetical protein
MRRLTLYHKMITVPEVFRVLEEVSGHGGCVLPVSPLGPIGSKVPRPTELVSSVSKMSVLVVTILVCERASVVVIIFWEDHDILGRTLPQQEMVIFLIILSVRDHELN